MKKWLARAVANTRLRSEEPRTRFARQPARWFAPARSVPESWFQDEDDAFPGHWRRFPEPWPRVDPADPRLREALATALDELPDTWREVVIARDRLGHDAADVSARLGLTSRQQQAILSRARARLREQIAERLSRGVGQ